MIAKNIMSRLSMSFVYHKLTKNTHLASTYKKIHRDHSVWCLLFFMHEWQVFNYTVWVTKKERNFKQIMQRRLIVLKASWIAVLLLLLFYCVSSDCSFLFTFFAFCLFAFVFFVCLFLFFSHLAKEKGVDHMRCGMLDLVWINM